jgi:hypothetical protein
MGAEADPICGAPYGDRDPRQVPVGGMASSERGCGL